ncbi:MAG: hypothetical protein KatS3mg110_4692 [Pirellulaceae bacterium]|nr:MAG: hypothetical protein KatS3mg110_1348 [Pirellulaceae bacterium]GIW95575.1 MAG: hypothetical protein KatS3mg110_3616 [Pirellulaceae bacterium]GIW96651.1 MAG: hypothetical protein KatS3mg110_4692 [Pirellulaceae bacterium]
MAWRVIRIQRAYSRSNGAIRLAGNLAIGVSLALSGPLLAQPGAAGRAAAPPQEAPPPPNPIVEAVREANPQSPTDLARAVRIMVDAREWSEAKSYLQKLLDGRTDAQAALRIYRAYGPAFVLELSLSEELRPEGAQLAEFIRNTVRALGEDPAWVDQQLEAAADMDRQVAALRALTDVMPFAGPRLLEVLADPNRSLHHPTAERLLAAGGQPTTNLLLAALDAQNPAVVLAAARLLAKKAPAQPNVKFALVPLALRDDWPQPIGGQLKALCENTWGPLPRKEVVLRWLEREFSRLFLQTSERPSPVSGMEQTWIWDAAQNRPVASSLSPEDQQRLEALQRATQLVKLAPTDSRYVLWHEAARREWQQSQAGLSTPLLEPVREADRATQAQWVERLLDYALSSGRAAAATWAARQLGQIGGTEQLHSPAGFSPLVRALSFPEQHVQFAAVEAIMKINPASPFAGSSRWRDTMGYFLNSRMARRVLVGNPNTEEGQSWAGWLRQMGFEVDLVPTGRMVLEQLAEVPDYDFVLLVDRLSQPPVDEVIQLAQTAPWGTHLRFAILAHSHQMDRWRLWAEDHATVLVWSRVFSADTVQVLVAQLESLPGRRQLPPEERVERTKVILNWLAFAAADPAREYLELVRLENRLLPLAESTILGPHAVAALGALGTARSQKRLVDVASQPGLPIELRQAAAQAFQKAVARRGLLLTSSEVLLQYDRYNESATLDTATQQVLGSLLDTIEDNRRSSANQ